MHIDAQCMTFELWKCKVIIGYCDTEAQFPFIILGECIRTCRSYPWANKVVVLVSVKELASTGTLSYLAEDGLVDCATDL